MLRFILWALLFYGIYRLIWPSQRTVPDGRSEQPGNSARQQGAHGRGGRSSSSATSGHEQNSNSSTGQRSQSSTSPSPGQFFSHVADKEGEYIEYEEVR
ncbi:MAG: DUF4834 family protein [Bacteroidetes bacterium]|nr:DUF4834 family protein [Bacteroidota bacterium]